MSRSFVLIWIVLLASVLQAQSQNYEPVEAIDLRRTTSLGNGSDIGVVIDPTIDPLSIDALMRPLDPHHTAEYLEKIGGVAYTAPYLMPSANLAGLWRLELAGGMTGQVELMLLQNGVVVFGRGFGTTTTTTFSASGTISGDVAYLDLVSVEELILYRSLLTASGDYLSGSYQAFDPQGRIWSGTAKAFRQV